MPVKLGYGAPRPPDLPRRQGSGSQEAMSQRRGLLRKLLEAAFRKD